MRTFLKTLMLAVAVMACSVAATAQTNSNKQRISREELAEKQAKHIVHELALDDATTARFVSTYSQCQKEIWALGPRVKKNAHRGAQAESDAETEDELQARFDHSQKILDIRQRYYKEYSKFMTQRQIKRMYELERQMMNRMAKRNAHGNKGRK